MKGRAALICAALLALLLLVLPAAAPAAGAGPTAGASMIGGSQAAVGQFPWMAFVRRNGKHGLSCSGSVVAPRVVLTAAHCVTNERTDALLKPNGFFAVTGASDWVLEGETSPVVKILRFPHFSLGAPTNGYGDAALLQLAAPTVAPALPLASGTDSKRALKSGTKVAVAGWGLVKPHALEVSSHLVYSSLVIEGTRCEGLVGRLCAVDFPSFTTGICNGDSGGPLFIHAGGPLGVAQVGISQAGFTNCSTRRPSIFQRTDLIANWIKAGIAKLE